MLQFEQLAEKRASSSFSCIQDTHTSICFIQSTNSSGRLIQNHPHRHTWNNV
jgi:hypothetical protein